MIDVSNVTISFEEENQTHVILDDVSLNIEKGEFICLLGPSGCGKSTLLNAMAGFLKPTSGEIKIENQIVQKPSMKYVTIFQNYGLLPWRTVQKNVELGLETKNYSKENSSRWRCKKQQKHTETGKDRRQAIRSENRPQNNIQA